MIAPEEVGRGRALSDTEPDCVRRAAALLGLSLGTGSESRERSPVNPSSLSVPDAEAGNPEAGAASDGVVSEAGEPDWCSEE